MPIQSILDWAERTPAKTALRYNGHDWSYRDLAQAIGMAARFFRNRDLHGPGTALLAFRNLLDFWIVAPALQSLGLTTVTATSLEVATTLGLKDLRAVVASPSETWAGLDGFAREAGVPLVAVGLAPGLTPLSPAELLAGPRGGHILLTSGTTGVPKKVFADPVRSDSDNEDAWARYVGFSERTVYNLFNYPAFTVAGYGIPRLCWHKGGTVIIDQGGALHDGLRHRDQTDTVLVPSMLGAILAQPEGSFERLDALRLGVGGGAPPEAMVEAARRRITGTIVQYYGSTEGGSIAATPLETAEDRVWHRIIPGRVVEVVDDNDEPLAVGQVGRIRVKEYRGLASYMDDPETTDRFFRHGYVYTGDLGVFREDGRMALRGRDTDVVNVMGHKIGVAAIEARLKEALGHDGVCLVALHEGGQDRVTIAIEGDAIADPDGLVAVAFGPAGAGFPFRFAAMPLLPRNAMGKVMRDEVGARLASAFRPG